MDATTHSHDPDGTRAERDFLVRALLEIGERERRRLGQELHDHLCQVLLGAAFGAKAVEQSLPPASPAAEELDHVVKLINAAVEQARAIARGLALPASDGVGFLKALQELVARPRAGISCALECERPVSLPDGAAAAQLFHIAEEALANAAQHSGGTVIVVRIVEDARRVQLEISDDGRGFKRPLLGRAGLGLALMKYRAEAIGARLACDTREGGGTSITCTLPRRK